MKQKEAVKGIVGRGNEKRGKENPSVKQAYSCVKLRVDPSPGNSGWVKGVEPGDQAR